MRKRLLITMIIITTFLISYTVIAGNISWFVCGKCATSVQKDSTPNLTKCPGGGVHAWSKICPVGNKNYQCDKCGVQVTCSSSPNVTKCSSGGAHRWHKL